MVRNQERRAALADAGIRVLATEGARGLTHRAVDAAAGTPRGTASNYFATRADLIAALVQRIGERLTPDPAVSALLRHRQPGREVFGDYVRDIVRRLMADPHVTLALFELRLEAARRPDVAGALAEWRRQGFEDDVAFNRTAGLPGGAVEIALFHFAVDGLVFDRLTQPLDDGLDVDDAIDVLVSRLLP